MKNGNVELARHNLLGVQDFHRGDTDSSVLRYSVMASFFDICPCAHTHKHTRAARSERMWLTGSRTGAHTRTSFFQASCLAFATKRTADGAFSVQGPTVICLKAAYMANCCASVSFDLGPCVTYERALRSGGARQWTNRGRSAESDECHLLEVLLRHSSCSVCANEAEWHHRRRRQSSRRGTHQIRGNTRAPPRASTHSGRTTVNTQTLRTRETRLCMSLRASP